MNLPYTKHIRFPGPGFMKTQAPLISGSANATSDELSELALLGMHLKSGVQLVVPHSLVDEFLGYQPSIPFNELLWPSRTVEVYLDKAVIPTVIGGVFSSQDMRNMGFTQWKEAHDPSLYVLIQERQKEVTIQTRYTLDEVMALSKMRSPEEFLEFHAGQDFDDADVAALSMSAMIVYKAIALVNEAAFTKHAAVRDAAYRNQERNRPLSDSFIFTGDPRLPGLGEGGITAIRTNLQSKINAEQEKGTSDPDTYDGQSEVHGEYISPEFPGTPESD